MKQVSGWWLPPKDGYFDRFIESCEGVKKNCFQREHLLEAFKHVKNWNVAIDVGAHVGFWARDMAEKFERVYCFEPAKDTFLCLEKNMAEFSNVTISNIAIGDSEGMCTVHDDEARAGNSGARFVKPSSGDTQMANLDCMAFDACDLLKIDVEGFELMVLHGAEKLIAKHKPVVIMETDKKFARHRYGWKNTDAEQFLLSLGYKCVKHMRPDRIFVPQ